MTIRLVRRRGAVTSCCEAATVIAAFSLSLAAGGCSNAQRPVLTFSGSAVGREAEVIRKQLDRFALAHPNLDVALRATPDAADQRHQLYVQWLNAHTTEPDVLQLDVVWTAEFAAAGWVSSLERYQPDTAAFFPQSVAAHRWQDALYALPWYIDVGMLYWRTDIEAAPPRDLDELRSMARLAPRRGLPYGMVWQGARYEGLVTVFLEFLGAYGGAILDARGDVAVDSAAAVNALRYMRDAVDDGLVPQAVLTWQEEQTRFAFQNGDALFMRNWPYAYGLLNAPSGSRVAGKFTATFMPAGPGGSPTAALGGAALAINAFSDQPADAYALMTFLLEPEQMLERARIAGQYPSRPALFDSRALAEALPIAPAEARAVIERAVPRPATPVYSQLSEILQIALHRALTGQQEPEAALGGAAESMRALLARVKLAPGS